ncbi:MAG TPA: alcohol dehydrogenase catalytic domain-containing protein [Gaiellaceae bacterium]|jgi:threonine dehydrogenase-like Zn-dependent dehydrogenase|nr:alcohol dehydrogenase catalytic domain-containing protein [Gaiellaceae bacterium]
MQGLVAQPGKAHTTRVEDVDEPAGDGVAVRVLEIGVCGTDREISEGVFGAAPEGETELVMGHEMVGVVHRDGHGFSKGDLVAATVRRSCGHCLACSEGAPDSCLSGDYVERGITRLDGFARELVIEDPAQLIAIPRPLGRLGVLAEPTSICARGVRHALAIGSRQPWLLQRALVVGGGAIGLLSTMLLRLAGVEVWTASLEESNAIADALGAHYVSTKHTELAELGRFDLVVEAAGDAQLMADSLGLLRRGGVACLLGIDGREGKAQIENRVLGVDTVLENRVLFGSVNANRQDWLTGVEALDRAKREFEGALEQLVAKRVPLDRFEEAFAFHGGKATLVLSEER